MGAEGEDLMLPEPGSSAAERAAFCYLEGLAGFGTAVLQYSHIKKVLGA